MPGAVNPYDGGFCSAYGVFCGRLSAVRFLFVDFPCMTSLTAQLTKLQLDSSRSCQRGNVQIPWQIFSNRFSAFNWPMKREQEVGCVRILLISPTVTSCLNQLIGKESSWLLIASKFRW